MVMGAYAHEEKGGVQHSHQADEMKKQADIKVEQMLENAKGLLSKEEYMALEEMVKCIRSIDTSKFKESSPEKLKVLLTDESQKKCVSQIQKWDNVRLTSKQLKK